MAKASTSVKVCWVDGWVKISGRTTAIAAEEEDPALVDVAGPAGGLQPHGDRARPGGEGEDLALVGALPVEEDRHDHDDQEQQVDQPGLVDEVEVHDALQQADDDGWR